MGPRVSGYVLAGGNSRRMQPRDGARVEKALLRFCGETLLERALRTVAEVCGSASILGGPAERCAAMGGYGRTVPDRVAGCGPVGGLATALDDAEGEWVLVMPVDLPLLPAHALRELVEAVTENGGPAVAVMSAVDGYQPLPVVLHRSARLAVKEALRQDERKLMPVLRAAAEALCPRGIRGVPARDGTGGVQGGRWFTNVNTPADLRAAEEVAMASNDSAQGASE